MGRNLPHAIYHWKGIGKTFPTIYRMRQVSTHNWSEFLFYGKKCLFSAKIAHKIKNLDPFWVETCRMRYIIGKALKRPFQRYIACGKFLLTMGLNSYFMCKQMSVFT